MSKMFTIAIVGRPNVGKSSLFNRIIGQRKAVVDDKEGVTLDRLYSTTEVFGVPIQVIDTGGVDIEGTLQFGEKIREQIEVAIDEADALIFVVDGKVGYTLHDEEVARYLFKKSIPTVLAVNKADRFEDTDLIHQFYAIGIENIVATSAEHGLGIAELLEAIVPSEIEHVPEESKGPRIALVGRPNVGKSTLINRILQKNRCVVSDIPGTTRDAIDTELVIEDQTYTFIDTAGIRRKKSEHEVMEKYAAIRTEEAIKRTDICVLVLDSTSGLTTQEKMIAKQIESEGKCCIIFFNKWDLVSHCRMEHCERSIREENAFLQHCPILFGSAINGRSVETLFKKINEVYGWFNERITTGKLNNFIEKAMQFTHPPMIQGKRCRVYYMTQMKTSPPKFILFVNNPKLMVSSYKKYLHNQLRKLHSFTGVPIELILRRKTRRSLPSIQAGR